MSDLLGLARSIVAHGVSVIPVSVQTKRPTLAEWKPYQTRLPSEEELVKWFGNRHGVNVATVTGSLSGLVVVDCDSEAAEEWAREHLPETPWRVQTSRGQHRYYRHPGGSVRNKAKLRTGDGKIDLDVRADGGYCVAPHSRHATGIVYEPLGNWNVPKSELPVFPIELLAPAPKPEPRPTAPHRMTSPEKVLERARKYLAATPKPEIGNRSDEATFIAACRIVLGFGVSEADAVELLWAWAGNREGWDREWVAEKARNALKYGVETPGGLRDAPDPRVHRRMTSSAEPETPPPIDELAETAEEPEPEALAYRFEPAFPPDHFVSRFVEYSTRCTDAALEYAEAVALAMLASATPGVRAYFGPYPGGLPTNLYVLLLGDSTASRKTTSIRLGKYILQTIDGESILPDLASPEAFIEQLAIRSERSSLWVVDEFGDLMEKIHHAKHMAGLRGILLTIYEGTDYTYRRHSKRKKSGKREEDVDDIRKPHLTVIGATTPAIFEALSARDVQSGFLARFGIIMPDSKPPRRKFHETATSDHDAAEEVAAWFLRLRRWANAEARNAQFSPESLDVLDQFALGIEKLSSGAIDPTAKTMIARLSPMAFKVAMLAAAGRPDTPDGAKLYVEQADSEAAVQVVTRWKRDAITFAARVGENLLERTAERCLRALSRAKGGTLKRRTIARLAHVDKKLLDAVEATVIDRGQIRLHSEKAANMNSVSYWILEC